MDNLEIIKAFGELGKCLRTIADVLETGATVEGKMAKNKKGSKKAQAQDEMTDDGLEAGEVETSDDIGEDVGEGLEEDFTGDAEVDGEEDFTEPTKKAKEPAKAKKVTIAQVNEACKARAKAGGKKGREQVLALLKKHFKTESISEIKPEFYGKIIQAMQVSQ